jgi:hypothetical protein
MVVQNVDPETGAVLALEVIGAGISYNVGDNLPTITNGNGTGLAVSPLPVAYQQQYVVNLPNAIVGDYAEVWEDAGHKKTRWEFGVYGWVPRGSVEANFDMDIYATRSARAIGSSSQLDSVAIPGDTNTVVPTVGANPSIEFCNHDTVPHIYRRLWNSSNPGEEAFTLNPGVGYAVSSWSTGSFVNTVVQIIDVTTNFWYEVTVYSCDSPMFVAILLKRF